MVYSALSSLRCGVGRQTTAFMAFRDSGPDTAERTGSLCVVIENDFLSSLSHKIKKGREGRDPAKCLSVSVRKFEGLAAYLDTCFLAVLLTDDECY